MPWILVAIVGLCVAAVRIRMLGIPLERDEGEYAYTGQLMLQGIPPYQLAYSMKFPGIDAANAAIMAVFGQTIVGIHLGFLLVNAATIVLIFLLGRRLFTPAAGVAASAAYALLSIGQGVFGAQAHATHFVALAAMGGTVLLLRAIDTRRLSTLFGSGILFGVAVLMKQHGVLFVAFGVWYLAWHHLAQLRHGWRSSVKDLAVFLCGVSVPLALTVIALWRTGVLGKFWFWTFTYAHAYAQEVPFFTGFALFRLTIPGVIGPNLPIWIIALAGLVLIRRKNEDRIVAIFVTGFLAFSFLALCPGLFFREHYFVLILPAVALLAGAAVGTALKKWPRATLLTYGVFVAALLFSVVRQEKYLFQMSPEEISRATYGPNPFPEAVQIGNYIQTHAAPGSSIAILGSEPEIPFYAHRRSATGYIYMYGLMESQPYALTMQKDFIREVEMSQPEYVVIVTCSMSWLRQLDSRPEIFDWWAAYQPQHYKQLVGLADVISQDHTEYRWGEDSESYRVQSPSAVLVYKRTDR
jgi:hypothetical protein